MMPLYPYATHGQAPVTLGLLAGHPLMTIAAMVAVFAAGAILTLAAASALRGRLPLVRGTGQIVGITPEADGWAVVDLWFRGDLMRIRTRDHGRDTFSFGEPVVVHHTRSTLGHVEVRRLQRVGQADDSVPPPQPAPRRTADIDWRGYRPRYGACGR